MPATDELVDRIFAAAKASNRTLTHEQIEKMVEDARASAKLGIHDQEFGIALPVALPCGEDARLTPAAAYCFAERICSKKVTARGSFDWPSQNIACFRTAGFRFVRAT